MMDLTSITCLVIILLFHSYILLPLVPHVVRWSASYIRRLIFVSLILLELSIRLALCQKLSLI